MCFLSIPVSLPSDLHFQMSLSGNRNLWPSQPLKWSRSTTSNSWAYQLCVMVQACVVVLKLLISKLLDDLERKEMATRGKSALQVSHGSSCFQARVRVLVQLRLACFFYEGLEFFTLSLRWDEQPCKSQPWLWLS